jgi:hypothetical protein
LDTKLKSNEAARDLINEVLGEGTHINVRKLDEEKSNLIKEINHTIQDKEFYNYKIPNYTVYASIQGLLSDRRNKKQLFNAVERTQIRENVVEHLIRKDDNSAVAKLKIDPNYNNAVYKFIVQRFHKKYDNKLTENQKKFLTKYAVYLISENKGVMQSSIQKEVEIIKSKIKEIKDESILKDKDLVGKLNECYKKLVVTNFDTISEENVLNILQYMKLVEEIES